MKKFVLLMLALMMLLTATLLPMSVVADESDMSDESDVSTVPTTAPTTASRELNPNKLNICVGAAAAKQGDTVEVPVTIETNPGIWGLNLDVHYDRNVLVLQTATFADGFKKDMSCLDIDNLSNDADHNYDIPFSLNVMANSITSNVKTTGLLATLTFLVIPGAELGETSISITYKPSNVIDVDGNNVLSAMHEGYVLVTEGKPAEPGVTYFPTRTTKKIAAAEDETKNGGLSSTQVILIVIGVVVVVGVVLAILVVKKPVVEVTNTKTDTQASKVDKAAELNRAVSKSMDNSSDDDGIDDQA